MTNHVERWFQFWAITGFTDSLGKYLHGGELGGIRREETKIPETRKPREARLFEQPSLPRGAPLLFHRVRRELLRGPINPALITSHFCWSLTRNRLGSRNGQSLSKSFSLSANNRQPVLRAPLPFGSFRLFDLLSLRSVCLSSPMYHRVAIDRTHRTRSTMCIFDHGDRSTVLRLGRSVNPNGARRREGRLDQSTRVGTNWPYGRVVSLNSFKGGVLR